MVVEIDEALILPHFRQYLDSKETYQFFVGTAGSGKSHFIVERALIMAMREERFRLIFARKTHESIKDSQFQLFKDYIRAWGLESIFKVKEQGMDIHCVNGNMLLSSGLDNEEKIKSIADPTHVWIEEMLGDKKSAAITRDDFNQLDIRLRGKKGERLQTWGTYNPVNEKSWIKEDFHTDIMESECIEKSKVDNCLIHWSNYRKNTFIDIDAYNEKLDRIAKSNPNTYRIYALGQWGKPDVQRPFISNFEYDKHVSEFALYQPNRQLYFSIDFNIDPFVCLCSHQWTDSKGLHKHFFKEICLQTGSIDEMCRKIQSLFPPMQLDSALWTGDATGHKRDLLTKNNMSAWLLLMKGLRIPPKRVKTPRSNPIVKDSRTFVDYVFSQHPDLKFHPDMKLTINEIQFTEADEEGNLVKKDRNKVEQRFDAGDCLRYDLHTWSKQYFTNKSTKF